MIQRRLAGASTWDSPSKLKAVYKKNNKNPILEQQALSQVKTQNSNENDSSIVEQQCQVPLSKQRTTNENVCYLL